MQKITPQPVTDAELLLRLLQEYRKNIRLHILLREARAAIEAMSQRDPRIAAWAHEWLAREVLEREQAQ